jgi:signal transduction histidine kinase/DNA-binding LacI/PurR family transcriptional regulator/DNA-binding response OmpR family regulator
MMKDKSSPITLGVLSEYIYESTERYAIPLRRGMVRAARQLGCNLLVNCGIGLIERNILAWPEPTPGDAFTPVGPWNTDGLLVELPISNPEHWRYLQTLRHQGFPLLFIGPGMGEPFVAADNAGGIAQALAHLVWHGHRQIAFISGAPAQSGDVIERLEGYRQALAANGLVFDEALVACGGHNYDGGEAAIRQILAGGRPFTGVIASNDASAMGAIHALQEAGKRVPEEVAVAGFDDSVEARSINLPLTTIHSHIPRLGYQAVKMLFEQVRDGTPPENLRLPTTLMIRQSCGCLPEAMLRVQLDLSLERFAQPCFTHRLTHTLVEHVLANDDSLTDERAANLCQQLITNYLESVRQHQGEGLLAAIRVIVHALEQQHNILHAWYTALAMLEEASPALLAANGLPDATGWINPLLDQARLYISERAWYQYNRRGLRQQALAARVSYLAAHLLETLDQAEIVEIINEVVPLDDENASILSTGAADVAVQHLYATPRVFPFFANETLVGFYEPIEDDALAQARLVGPHRAAGQTFPSRSFPPPALYPSAEHFCLFIFPLVLPRQMQPTGFVAFNVNEVTTDLVAITRTLTAAFHRALLVQQLDAARQVAEEANRLKSGFLSTVSHELRTPLNLMTGMTEMLLQEKNIQPPSVYEDLGRIYASGQHLDRLIRDVLDLARSDADQLTLACEAVQLDKTLQVVAMTGEQLSREKGVAWQMRLPPDLPPVWGDRTRICQVALNLVANAFKFTRQGQVTFSAQAGPPGFITLSVRDSGLGIAADEQALIFDEFRQAQRTSGRGYGGMGLGLAICKRLIALHGGQMAVQSAGVEGEGSTFTFTLPVAQEGKALPGTNDQTVLILGQGHCSSMKNLATQLTQMGYLVNIQAIESQSDWAAVLAANPPGAVVIDTLLAQQRGFEILHYIRQNPTMKHLPVLFYNQTGEDIAAAISWDTLNKPLRPQDLTQALAQQGIQTAANRPQTILIVDDDANFLAMHTRIVQTQLPGCQVLTAANGRAGLEAIRQHSPNLVLLDLMMPEMDGFAVLEALRQQPHAQRIPVIVLTSQVLTEADMDRLNRGVATVLSKGLFNSRETLAHIESVLQRNPRLGSETQRLVRKAMAYIHQHFAEPISRSTVAAYIGVAESYLSRCFGEETGLTFKTYLNRYRIQRAKELLAAGNSIEDVTFAVGFSERSYFSRVFQQETGQPPGAYRKMSQKSI